MRRRDFIAAAACVGGALRLPSAAAQSRPVIGYLAGGTLTARPQLLDAFKQGLADHGLAEGRNVTIEYRAADNRPDQLDALAAELVRMRVDVIAAIGGPGPALASRQATKSIPIVFTTGGDPVAVGLVQSLSRPGGNATGVALLNHELTAKRIEMMHELLPAITRISALLNPRYPDWQTQLTGIEEATKIRNLALEVLRVSTVEEIDAVFQAMRARRPQALVVGSDPFFLSRQQQLVTLAAGAGVPASYATREFVERGGLMSYGPRLPAAYRLAGTYVGRILKGENPADLPVQRPTRFELMLNLKTAAALGIEVPPMLLARSDEVIE